MSKKPVSNGTNPEYRVTSEIEVKAPSEPGLRIMAEAWKQYARRPRRFSRLKAFLFLIKAFLQVHLCRR